MTIETLRRQLTSLPFADREMIVGSVAAGVYTEAAALTLGKYLTERYALARADAVVQSLSWSVAYGVVPVFLDHVASTWQQCMHRERDSSGTVVSGIIGTARAVYCSDHGCPSGGEPVVLVQGASNPAFDRDMSAYRDAVLRVIEAVRRELKQRTARVIFSESTSAYLRDAG